MHCITKLLLIWLSLMIGKIKGVDRSPPNVIVIVADDLGWNDVSFHSSKQIFTPNIDVLAYHGVILNRHYCAPFGTASQVALMTGSHPLSVGTQSASNEPDQPWTLDPELKLMPEYFRDAGYATHLIGKWGLGFSRKDYTPTQRGFDSHFGFLGPYIDYWDHSLRLRNTSTRGLDMRRNLDVDYSVNGSYATDLFNGEAVRLIREHDQKKPLLLVLTHLAPHTGNEDDPMQAPAEEVEKFDYIRDEKRRVLAAMISKVDEGVGQIIQTLAERDMLDNSIVLFYADNGAPTVGMHSNSGSNFPLRGQKYSPWEGAVRTVAAIWSPLLNLTAGRVSNQWIHVSDWLPTLAHAAGIEGIPIGSEIDGRNQWEALKNPAITVRNVVMNNIDELHHYSSYSRNGWKYVNGTSWEGKFDNWMGELEDEDELSEEEYVVRLAGSVVGRMMPLDLEHVARLRRAATVECEVEGQVKACQPMESPCLFNLMDDPCERNNVALDQLDILEELREEVERYRQTAVEPRNKPADPRSDPGFYNNTWTWWLDEIDSRSNMYMFPVMIIVISIAIVALLLLFLRPFKY
ncbi:arylsulfatase B isoform X2 [Aedes aegypti]|uniref:Sulfatase N-terminal domain-containing protein n=1 Tax=Aedes aegypti TaxID=7159 RepID=A0A6I8U8B0_AEDAE|nr:arylsulfatase B isoform X2 [Aedes aegypti]XP_021711782.1 arylsulfatase B isoform X2 [Aedes aegypti]